MRTTTCPSSVGRRARATAAAFAVVAGLLLTPSPVAAAGSLAPLPDVISATYVDRGQPPYVFQDRKRDLAQVRRAFNTAVVSATPWQYGDTSLVQDVRAAGMAAVIEFDDKADYAQGRDVSHRVEQIIATTRLHPGLVAGISVADQLNKGTLTLDQQLGYLAATGGRFHAELPGVPVFVDVASWELTCGKPQQASCAALTGSRWSLETNAVLTRLAAGGDIDGVFLSDNLKGGRADVNTSAYATARALLPRPFRVVARTSHLSFPEQRYPGTDADAAADVGALVLGPRAAGADGTVLWSWHRPWVDEQGVLELRTFLDKDGRHNALWERLVASNPSS